MGHLVGLVEGLDVGPWNEEGNVSQSDMPRLPPTTERGIKGRMLFRHLYLTLISIAGDTRPVPPLNKLAASTDVLILQNMGPIKDVSELSYESQLLINVSLLDDQLFRICYSGDLFSFMAWIQ